MEILWPMSMRAWGSPLLLHRNQEFSPAPREEGGKLLAKLGTKTEISVSFEQ